jgi:hypothetical protein
VQLSLQLPAAEQELFHRDFTACAGSHQRPPRLANSGPK